VERGRAKVGGPLVVRGGADKDLASMVCKETAMLLGNHLKRTYSGCAEQTEIVLRKLLRDDQLAVTFDHDGRPVSGFLLASRALHTGTSMSM
jgi:hypothetical protein